MSDIKTVFSLVQHVLEDNPQTRNSDNVLYLEILKHYANIRGVNIHTLPVSDFLEGIDRKIFPAFETVRRSRQKVQETHPELAATKRVRDARRRTD